MVFCFPVVSSGLQCRGPDIVIYRQKILKNKLLSGYTYRRSRDHLNFEGEAPPPENGLYRRGDPTQAIFEPKNEKLIELAHRKVAYLS